jgi:hypothetical protein
VPVKSTSLRWFIILAAIAFVGLLAYSSLQEIRQRYEVCVAFRGASHCATAAGATYDQAVRSAQEIDCELLANGRDQNMVCLDTQPTRIRSTR